MICRRHTFWLIERLATSQVTNLKTNHEWVFASDFLEGKRDGPEFNPGTRGFRKVVPKPDSSGESRSRTETPRSPFQEEPVQRWRGKSCKASHSAGDKVCLQHQAGPLWEAG